MMQTGSYIRRRGQLETYFDRTAAEAWSRLTSDAPVSKIRATVRAGRDRMRATLLDWLPADMQGLRVLDAGCGTGAMSVELARRGAEVVAIDLSPTLVELARERLPEDVDASLLTFLVGDMHDPDLGRFDHVVAMDSLIHYKAHDVHRVINALEAQTKQSILFTFAPRTPLLTVMHNVGLLFPRGDRAPAIEPVSAGKIQKLLQEPGGPAGSWGPARTERISSGFYTSQALEVKRT